MFAYHQLLTSLWLYISSFISLVLFPQPKYLWMIAKQNYPGWFCFQLSLSLFPFPGGSLCCFRLFACAGSHEKGEGQVEAKGGNRNIRFSNEISWQFVHTYDWNQNVSMYVNIGYHSKCVFPPKVDMISLGTYLKRFNFKLHAKQVRKHFARF